MNKIFDNPGKIELVVVEVVFGYGLGTRILGKVLAHTIFGDEVEIILETLINTKLEKKQHLTWKAMEIRNSLKTRVLSSKPKKKKIIKKKPTCNW